jgi:hypothetical protein
MAVRTDRKRITDYLYFDNMGLYNVDFSKMMKNPRNFRYATSHGLLHNYGHTVWGFPVYKNMEWMRPITSIQSANLPGYNGLMITQALDPETPGRISRTMKTWARIWHWTDIKGDAPQGGLIASFGELTEGDTWWFVYTDGLFHSDDRGKTMVKVLSEAGKPVER